MLSEENATDLIYHVLEVYFGFQTIVKAENYA